MTPVTHYEVYQVKYDRWALRQRFSAGEEDPATQAGRELEVGSGLAVQVIEESLDRETGNTRLRVVARFGNAPAGTKAPPENTDISSRVVMVIINALGIGAIGAVIAAIAVAPMHAQGAAPGAYNLLLMFVFAASVLASGLALFKIYIPVDLILWRVKNPEARARTAEILTSGERPEAAARPARAPFREARPKPVVTAEEQTSFQLAALPADPAAAPAAAPPGAQTSGASGETPAAVPSAADAGPVAIPGLLPELAAARDAARAQLFVFTDAALGMLALTRPQLQAFERFGLNLYFAGAVVKTAETAQLPLAIRDELIRNVLERAGTNAATAQSFGERLESSLLRPRYRALVDAGADALADPPDENGLPRHGRLNDLLREWSDPTARGGQAVRATFLLTDIVGSTALTAKLGNSAAQKVVRAHNAIVRTAAKDFRGKEVKHTGDGILLTFTDPTAAARAAMDIQQEAFTYAADNPEAPLSLRVGLHTGQASAEDGDYSGESVLLLDGICAAGEGGQITCSEEIVTRTTGPAFRFTDLGPRLLKGTEIELKVFNLEWAPKHKAPGPLEYRQIGAKPAAKTAEP